MSWEIHNFSTMSVAAGEKIKSSVFVVGKRQWQVHLYPCGDKDDKDHVTCYLHYLEEGEQETTVRWKATFKKKTGEELRPALELMFTFGKIKSRGWRGVIARKQNFLGADDMLIVDSELEVYTNWVTTDNINSTIIDQDIDLKAELCKDLACLVQNKSLFSDVVFVIEGEHIPAHRSILAARSPVFRSMFTNGMRESTEGTIHIPDIDKQLFQEMLSHIYTCKCDPDLLNERTVELLAVADKYDLAGLKLLCEQVMLKRITKGNASAILATADMYHAPVLKKHVLSLMTQYFFEIIATDGFKELCSKSPHLVTELTDLMAVQAGTKQPPESSNPLKRKREN
jgi:speckle-type POZ protein